jgi:MoaA/NifB/PqqE/SkfB family radical SAM enzyme
MSKRFYIIREIANSVLIPIAFNIEKCFMPPTIAGLFLTKRCNSRCTICEYWKNKDYSEDLTASQWAGVLIDLKSLGVKVINFTADGEIFTREDSFEIMDQAKKLGFMITINTNGLVLNNFIQQIIELDPLQIQISLDVFDDASYKIIRGIPDGFTIVKNNIMSLKKAGFKKISIGSVATRHNIEALIALQKFCIQNGFVYRLTAFQFEGFGVDNRKIKESYQDKYFLDSLSAVINELSKYPINNTQYYLKSMADYYVRDKYHPLNCIVGYYKIFILPNGDVSLCNIMHEKSVTGNIKENTLSNIWFSKRSNEIRQKIKNKKCPSCWLSCFAEDNIRFSPLFLLKNTGYFWKKTIRLLKPIP